VLIGNQAALVIERKRMETELEESEEFHRQLMSNVSLGVVIIDPTTRMIEVVNEAAAALFGADKENIVGHRCHSYLCPALEGACPVCDKGQEVDNAERAMLCADGSRRSVIKTVKRTNIRGQEKLLECFVDITERKRAEDALRESGERIRLLLNSAAEAIYGIDMNGNCTFCNNACLRLLGYQRPDELLGKNMHWQVHSKHSDGTPFPIEECRIFQAFNKGEGTHVDDEVLWRSDGTSFPVEYWSYPQFHNGVVVGAVMSFLDITERKRAEEALRESVQRYELVMDGSSAGLWDWDVPNKRIHFSSRWKAMRGYTDAEIGESETEWSSRLHPDDAPRVMAALQAHFEGRTQVYEEEYRIRCKDGSIKWIFDRGKAVRDDAGLVIRAAGSEIDITGRKHAEEEIRSIQAQLRIAMDLAKLVHWEYDVDKDQFTFDDQFYALYGTSEEKEGGQLMSSATYAKRFVPPEEAGSIAEEIGKAISTTNPNYLGQMTHTIIRSNGERRIISARFGVVKDAAGRTIKTYGANQDITELKRVEEALRQANAKLGILNTITRHDINNQMMALNGFLELAKLREKDPNLTTYLEKMSRAAANVQEQIDFTKVYQDLGNQAPAWASLGRQTADAFVMLNPPGVALEDGTNGVEILADPLAEKVPYNLIDNTMRHGGHVTRIKMSAEQFGDVMKIVYEDDGVGISAEDKMRLFQKGFGKNTGYGLFLIREILAITGITITEKGQAGKGARFEMLVPPGAWRRIKQ
jgi:PAS domain S-box-containing protein